MPVVIDPQTGAQIEVPPAVGLADAYGRIPGLRVENLDYIWSRKEIGIGQQGDVIFFDGMGPTATPATRRDTNFRGSGFLSVHEAFLLHQLTIKPEYGSSGADLVEMMEVGRVSLKVNGKVVNEFLLKDCLPGTGFSDAGVPYPGRPNPLEPFRLADVPLGAGESLELILSFDNRINTQNIVRVTAQLGGTRWKPAM